MRERHRDAFEVSFPQYGYKAGLSDGAFPHNTQFSVARLASVLRALRLHRRIPRTVPRDAARLSTTVQAAFTALHQGPSLQPGFSLQVINAYLAHQCHSQSRHIFLA
jgi:hypothetical protein